MAAKLPLALTSLRPRAAVGTRLLRHPEDALADDVALHLRRARVDRAGARAQEGAYRRGRRELATRERLDRRTANVTRWRHRLGTEDVERELGDLLVVLAPEQLDDRRLRSGVAAR